jgi:flagellar motility protein MotE (MotC chaperone)
VEKYMAKRGRKIPVALVIILILLISVTLAIVFNIGGIRDLVFSIIGKDIAEDIIGIPSDQDPYQAEREFINTEKTKLMALRTDLENYRAQLQDKENELQEKEAQLLEKEREIERLSEKLSVQYDDLIELTKIYEQMDGEEAAAILSQIDDTQQVILIIRSLKKEKSAEILGLMDAKLAADILSKMY